MKKKELKLVSYKDLMLKEFTPEEIEHQNHELEEGREERETRRDAFAKLLEEDDGTSVPED